MRHPEMTWGVRVHARLERGHGWVRSEPNRVYFRVTEGDSRPSREKGSIASTRRMPASPRTYPQDTPLGTCHSRLHQPGGNAHKSATRPVTGAKGSEQDRTNKSKSKNAKGHVRIPYMKHRCSTTRRNCKRCAARPGLRSARPLVRRYGHKPCDETKKRTALGHINVIAGGAAGAIWAGLRLNGDGLRRANRFAELATAKPT